MTRRRKSSKRRGPKQYAGERMDGRVIGRVGPVFLVETALAQTTCIARGAGKTAVVGDRVEYIADVDAELANGLIVGIHDRKSTLARRDALGRRKQVLAANLDRIFIVSAIEPELREGLIDRYLVAAATQDIDAHIVVNKTDLLDAAQMDIVTDRLTHYETLGYSVHYVSAKSNSGLAALEAALADRVSILVGHSGVGKTSLINSICPGVSERVQAISDATGRGQHTTTTSALYKLPKGGEVVDSPGVRSFGLWGIKADEVKNYFPEFVLKSDECKFSDCQHVHEPKCAIRDALENQSIDARRYQSYLNIRQSLLDEGL
ncbi:MAG: ribosome small subunit-dependent GTPase A [Myxococcota bacterium]|nr:ribosome small subunit-dependent GTPase A [Myxococcota bacterium]